MGPVPSSNPVSSGQGDTALEGRCGCLVIVAALTTEFYLAMFAHSGVVLCLQNFTAATEASILTQFRSSRIPFVVEDVREVCACLIEFALVPFL